MADNEGTNTQEQQAQPPSQIDLEFSEGRALMAAAAKYLHIEKGSIDGYNFDASNLQNPFELDAVTSGAFDQATQDFVKDFMADPHNQELIYGGIRVDGLRTGGNPDLWYIRKSEENHLAVFTLQPDGTYDKTIQTVNQGTVYTDKEATAAANRTGQNPTRNLWNSNELSAEFWTKMVSQYAKANDLPDDLTQMADIDRNVNQRREELKRNLRAMTGRENVETLYDEITKAKPTLTEAQLKAKINPHAENAGAEAGMANLIAQLRTYETFATLTALRDKTILDTTGILPSQTKTSIPTYDRPWIVDWSAKEHRDAQGRLSMETVGYDFRVWNANTYGAAQSKTLTADMFKGNADSAAFIEKQGWEGRINTAQFSALTRHMMVVEAANRHGITDPYSTEAKTAFLQDYREGYFHPHDMKIAFSAGAYTRPNELNTALEAQRKGLGLGTNISTDGIEFDAPKAGINAKEFQSFFGQPTSFTDASGTTYNIADATITLEQAKDYFFRMPQYREDFGYDFKGQYDGYDMSVEEFFAKHGNEKGSDGQTVAEALKEIMTNVSAVDYYEVYSADGGRGDFQGDLQRTYLTKVQERMREQTLAQKNVITPETAPERDINAVTPHLDKDSPPIQKTMMAEQDTSVTPQELKDASTDISIPPAHMIDAMNGGPERINQQHGLTMRPN